MAALLQNPQNAVAHHLRFVRLEEGTGYLQAFHAFHSGKSVGGNHHGDMGMV